MRGGRRLICDPQIRIFLPLEPTLRHDMRCCSSTRSRWIDYELLINERPLNCQIVIVFCGEMAAREGRFATEEMGMAVNSLQKQPARGPGRPFEKGRSGNPAGRPGGARNNATLAAEALFDSDAEALRRKAVELALGGSRGALRRRPLRAPLGRLAGLSVGADAARPRLATVSISA